MHPLGGRIKKTGATERAAGCWRTHETMFSSLSGGGLCTRALTSAYGARFYIVAVQKAPGVGTFFVLCHTARLR